MSLAFQKLRKIITLEREQGCVNRAVIGGLGRFLAFWEQDATKESSQPDELRLIEMIAEKLKEYGAQDIAARVRNTNVVLAAIFEMEKKHPTSVSPKRVGRKVEKPARRRPSQPDQSLDSLVTSLRGVSVAYAKRLQRLGVTTINDLLYLFPRQYDDFSALKTISSLMYGEEVTVLGRVEETRSRIAKSGIVVTTCIIGDSTGVLQVTWFNQPYLAKRLRPGREIMLSGKVGEYMGRLVLESPVWEPLDKEMIHTGRIVPVYPLTEGVGARWLRKLMKTTLEYWVPRVVDPFPASLRQRANLLNLPTALSEIHFPDNHELLEKARRRLCFEEFFLIQLGVLRQRQDWQSQKGYALSTDEVLVQRLLDALPFKLTNAQMRAIREIHGDLSGSRPMSRLLQGDVGSGKTVVALAAILTTITNGLQAAIMAPTEILAEQHYKNFTSILKTVMGHSDSDLGADLSRIRIELLTGSATSGEKERIHKALAEGDVDIAVGTHALIQGSVRFKDLGLVIIDEQHRFGVLQRAALRGKEGDVHAAHVLVMSATPIPRTLSLTLYGDLDITVIDEMPPHRKPVETHWVPPPERERAYEFVRSQIESGRQAFIICPLVEESDKIEARAAVEEHQRLQKVVFPSLHLGLLHGRMKSAEKRAVMDAFYRGECDILVSTAVVEVGIDVQNATVMLVEGANRFGLAQLHQFRGRVGRGEDQAYCLLLADSPTPEAEQRLRLVEEIQDGFRLAEEDLKMRGPGEFFGTRQSGLPSLKVARLSDVRILEDARVHALELFERDPNLERTEHQLLAEKVAAFWNGQGDPS